MSMFELEVFGSLETSEEDRIRSLVDATLSTVGVDAVGAHLSVSFVGESAIRDLNRVHRHRDLPTDVLSFPVDGVDEAIGPREFGDVVICRSRTRDVDEAVVHGVLHLLGFDHETDGGEMLDLQREVLAGAVGPS